MFSQILKKSNDVGYLGLKKWIALKAANELLKERIAQHPLWVLVWECTLRCNLHCRHCGSDCRAHDIHPDMPREDFLRVLDSISLIVSYTCDGFTGRYEGEIRDQFYHCEAGITIGSILIDGSISACNSIRYNHIQGNIYKDDFIDVWQNRFKKYRDRSWTKKGICADCEMYSFCLGNGMHLYDDDDNLLHCDYYDMKYDK